MLLGDEFLRQGVAAGLLCPGGCAAEAALSRHPKGLAWVCSLTHLHCGMGTGGCRGEASLPPWWRPPCLFCTSK